MTETDTETDTDNEYDAVLQDDLAGLRDAIEVLDWPGALEIAAEIEKSAPAGGWPIVGDLAKNLCASLQVDNADVVPADVIEVLVNTMALCLARDYRNLEDLDPELTTALRGMKEKYSF